MCYATLLHYFIKESLTIGDYITINYVIAIRTEYDLLNISEAYNNLYKANLIDDIQVNISYYVYHILQFEYFNNHDQETKIATCFKLQSRFGDDPAYCESINKLLGNYPAN